MRALTKAREARGWSYGQVARASGLSEQQILNLERERHTRTTIPAQITVATLIALLETFPELDLPDFIGTELSVR